MAYEWRANLVCIATYKTLEGDSKMDQFEKEDLPFDDAADKRLAQLRYYPRTTGTREIIESAAYTTARKFIKLVASDYSVKKENPEVDSTETIDAIVECFASDQKTFRDLAEVMDAHLKFSDE